MRSTLVSLSLLALSLSNGAADALDSVRLELETRSTFWFGFVKYSGYAVAVGCAMEAPETFILIKRWWLLRFRDTEREETREDRRRWIVPLAAIGLLIIVVGIVAETYCEGRVSDIDALLRAHESDKITAAEDEAASATKNAGAAAFNAQIAKDSAKQAGIDAGTAKNLAAGARTEADAFERKIESANKTAAASAQVAAEAESHLAESLERAVSAEKEALQLKKQLADRTLSDKQVELIAGKLGKYGGQEYDVTAYWDSPESVGIANRVHLALQSAQWKFLPMTAWRALMGGLVGIKVDVHPNADDSTLKAARDLTLALQAEGLEAKLEMENPKNPKSNAISLSVGSKR